MTRLSPEERAEKIQLELIRMEIDLAGALTATEILFANHIREAEKAIYEECARMVLENGCPECDVYMSNKIRSRAREI